MSEEQRETNQNSPPSPPSSNNTPAEPLSGKPKAKDKWDIIDIILKPVGGLMTALVIGVLGYYTQSYLRDLDRTAEQRAEQERKIRLYTELLSQREQSESKLRSEMFSKIIDSFITKSPKTKIDEQILDLELLVHNFHESLHLTPLFAYLHRKLRVPDENISGEEIKQLEKRLKDLAKEVARQQLLALATHGETVEFSFLFTISELEQGNYIIDVQEMTSDKKQKSDPQLIGEGILHLEEQEQRFKLRLEEVDLTRERFNVILDIEDDGGKPLNFWLDYFDFPMIDNTRIKGGNRIAVVLNQFDATLRQDNAKNEQIEGGGLITVIGFPEAYASLKDRAFLQDILEGLVGKDSKP